MKAMAVPLLLLVAGSVGVAGAARQPAEASAQSRVCTADQALPASQTRIRVDQCSEQVGPFATQDTAWARWRQAQGSGYAVSNGVFPCYDAYSTRGYCFNVFTC